MFRTQSQSQNGQFQYVSREYILSKLFEEFYFPFFSNSYPYIILH